jgi:hypothetical protein
LRVARTRILEAAAAGHVNGSYEALWLLWNHWRLPARAPECPGLPDVNVHDFYALLPGSPLLKGEK